METKPAKVAKPAYDFADPRTGLYLPKKKLTEAEQIHSRRFRKREFFPIKGEPGFWAIDIMFLDQYSKKAHGFKMILNIINTPSRFLYSYPMKAKSESADRIAEWIASVQKNPDTLPPMLAELPPDRRITLLQADKGTEFINKKVEKLLAEHDIELFTTSTKTKMAIVERLNGNLRHLIENWISANDSYDWPSVLPQIVENYNSHINAGIGEAPADFEPEDYIDQRVAQETKEARLREEIKAQFPIGSTVRIARKKQTFEKGAIPVYLKGIYVVEKYVPPKSFELRGDNDESKTVGYDDMLLVTRPAKKVTETVPPEPLPTRRQLINKKKQEQLEKAESIDRSNIIEGKRERKPSVKLAAPPAPPAPKKAALPKKAEPAPPRFIIEKLLARKKIKGKVVFEVKWLGYPKTTFEPRSSLIEDTPELVREFEASH